jgi:hypothetical protein
VKFRVGTCIQRGKILVELFCKSAKIGTRQSTQICPRYSNP